MKKSASWRLIAVVALAAGLRAATAEAGPLMDRIEAGDTIRLGFANEIPFAYPGDDGSPKGFVNAITIGILSKMGFDNIEPVQMSGEGSSPACRRTASTSSPAA